MPLLEGPLLRRLPFWGGRRVRAREDAVNRLLWEIDRRILHQESLKQALVHLVTALGEIFKCPYVWVGLKENDGRVSSIVERGLAALPEATLVGWEEDDPDPRPAAVALRTGEVQIGRVTLHGEGDWRRGSLILGLHSYACFPLRVKGSSVGVIAMAFQGKRLPPPDAVQALKAIADQVAISVMGARAQERIRLQQVALESSPNGVMITEVAGPISWVNAAFASITGFEQAEAYGRAPRELLLVEQAEPFWETVTAALMQGLSWRGEHRNRRKDGTAYLVEVLVTPVRDETGAIAHHVWTLQDVTDRKAHEARVQYLTVHDPLTGLPNRHTLEEYLAAPAVHPRALLFVGADRLRLVNDVLGKQAGDEALIRLSEILQGALGPEQLLVRLDDDLFGVLARVEGVAAARALAEELRAAVAAAELQLLEGGVALTVSVGGVLHTEGQESLRLAGQALREAKRLGRDRVLMADDLRETGQPAGVVLRLQEALGGVGFQLHLQPIKRLATGATEFHEVLLRLQEPDGALLLPDQFMEAAAQYDLMPHVDGWVVAQVLRLLVERPELCLFVNLSGQGLSAPALLDSIEAQVRGAGQAVTGRLIFEITETAAVRDLGRARLWMNRLSGLGVRFALDDFGSGFASFEYLGALPVQFVKLSGVFVRSMATDPRHRAMVEAITTVAHALEKAVIAEWVESHQVADLLTAMGAEFGQGFALGRPGPIEVRV